jgi:predicted Na+-dependent transporter
VDGFARRTPKASKMNAAFDLAWVIAIVLILVGIYALAAPQPLARAYGVPAEGHDAHGYVRATGMRDIAFGVALAATAYFHSLPLLIVLAVVGIVVSVVDLWIVWHHGHAKRPHAAHAIHASGIVAFILVIAMALFAIGR